MKRILAGILSLLFVFSILAVNLPVPAAEASSNLNDLYKQLSELEKRQKDLERQKALSENTEQKEIQKINLLGDEIESVEEQIATLNNIIKKLDQELESKNKELAAANQKLGDYYELYKKRIRAIYEQGEVSYLEVLLESEGFSDFMIRLDLVQEIIAHDNDLMASMEQQRDNIRKVRDEINENKKKNTAAHAQIEKKKATLSAKRAESQKLVSQLSAEQKKLGQQIKQAHADIDKLNDKIDDLISKDAEFVGGEFIWPVPGYTRITSPFGYRYDPFTGERTFHKGIDIGAPRGTRIVASNRGVVVAAAYDPSGGNYVVIDHGGGYSTRYFHCNKVHVKKGDTVAKGEHIADVGTTGRSTGPHLHFEVRKNKVNYDPLNYVKRS